MVIFVKNFVGSYQKISLESSLDVTVKVLSGVLKLKNKYRSDLLLSFSEIWSNPFKMVLLNKNTFGNLLSCIFFAEFLYRLFLS